MGAKRKVDAKLYAKIKKEAKLPSDDKMVMEKYGVGQAIVRAIRNSNSYTGYLVKTSGRKAVIEKRNFKVNPKAKKVTRILPETTVQERTMIAWYGFVLFAIIGFISVGVMIVRWIASWFGA